MVFSDHLRIFDAGNAEAHAAELFRECFNAPFPVPRDNAGLPIPTPPENWRQYVALYRWPDGKEEAANDALTQPVFHNLQWHTAPVPLPPGEVVLAGMMTLPSDELPGAEKQPRRLFLFLHLQP